jgi:signal transduction histidine kinase
MIRRIKRSKFGVNRKDILMSRDGNFLTVPIKAIVSDDGMLVSADPALLRLQILAGGQQHEAIALPELFALVRLALQTGLSLERQIVVADAEQNIALWVRVMPMGDQCEISVLGWQELQAPETGITGEAKSKHFSVNEPDALTLDKNYQIVSGPAWLDADAIGMHIASVFIVEASSESDLPLIDALAERKSIKALPAQLAANGKRCCIDLEPIWSQDNILLGFVGHVCLAVPEPEFEPARQLHTKAIDIGEQLAPILKQPLSRIIANAETIHARLNGPLRENYAGYAQDIANAARHLSELVSDMEDLAAIDRTDFSVAKDRVEFGDIARRVAGLLSLKAADHQIEILIPSEHIKVDAIAEFRRVLQIALNLVGNAIRYAADGSQITLEIADEGATALFAVNDQGDGIAIEKRELVFEKFERLGRSGDGGSGLGLYISRRLARAMGGDLTVTDASQGGARFELRLPRYSI